VLFDAVYSCGVIDFSNHGRKLLTRTVWFSGIHERISELNLVSSSAIWLDVLTHLVLIGDADVL
jgi:hypothetical protein